MFVNCFICLELTLPGLGVTVCAVLCVRLLTLSTLCATENCELWLFSTSTRKWVAVHSWDSVKNDGTRPTASAKQRTLLVNVLLILLIFLRPLGLCQAGKSKHAMTPLGVDVWVHGGSTFGTFGGGSECECAPSTFTRALVTVCAVVCVRLVTFACHVQLTSTSSGASQPRRENGFESTKHSL
jgi:hypothetical protein